MTTVAERIVAALAAPGRDARSGASSATRSTRSPTRSAARTASSGSACATRRRARSPPPRRPSSPATLGGLHGHGRARARSTCSTASTTPRSRTRRCSPSAARCRSPRSAATSSRRSTTTRCSPTSRCSADTITSPEQLPGLLEQAVNARCIERGVAVLTLPGDVGGLDARQGHAAARASSPRRRAPCPTPSALREAAARDRRGRRRSRCSSGAARARRAPRCSRWPSGSPRRWCSRSRPRRGSSTTTRSRSARPG